MPADKKRRWPTPSGRSMSGDCILERHAPVCAGKTLLSQTKTWHYCGCKCHPETTEAAK